VLSKVEIGQHQLIIGEKMANHPVQPFPSPPVALGEKITVEEALAQLPGPQGERFVEVFKHGSLVVEMVAPPSRVPLPPHPRDEVYVVVQGSGELMKGETRLRIGPGDFVFVAAGVEHHFENFSDDLTIWALFYGPEGGEGNTHQPLHEG
jgi:mannose-6-phosphate isomerase-like protein (cupin superfamily)